MNTPTNPEALPPTSGSPSSDTPETDAINMERYAHHSEGYSAMFDHARKMERERDAAREAAKYAESYMRHHHSCRTQSPLSEAVAETCDCGLVETWREVRKGILSENVPDDESPRTEA